MYVRGRERETVRTLRASDSMQVYQVDDRNSTTGRVTAASQALTQQELGAQAPTRDLGIIRARLHA